MSKEIKCIFPVEELKKLNKDDVGTTLYCNNFFNGKKYGGLLLVCDNKLIKKLNIANYDDADTPVFAFRMFSSKQFFFTDYLFEFQIQFEAVKEETNLHLKQDSKQFRDFCKSVMKHKSFAILFLNVDTGLLIPKYLHLQDDDDLDWLVRNYDLSKNEMSGSVMNTYKKWGELSKFVQENNSVPTIYFNHNSRIPFLDVVRVKK